MRSNYKIRINNKYSLEPLLKVAKDDLSPIFNKGKGVYICNYPEPQWYEQHALIQKKNYSIEKKTRFFELMQKGSVLLSPTQDSMIKASTQTYQAENIFHFGSAFTGRIAQFIMTLKIIIWIIKNKTDFNYCLIYNFYPGEVMVAAFCRYVLKMHVVFDFEDDYTNQSQKKWYKPFFNLVKEMPHEVICITSNMKQYFPKAQKYVFNGFIDLSYTSDVDFTIKNNVKFLYSGALDEIRGVDLIPDIVMALRKKIENFEIYISGSGSLENQIKTWNHKEITFLGFLNSDQYQNILAAVDMFLVLQKPEHPFSKGSFPSKIEFYSKYKKPIYEIQLSDN